MPTRRTTVRTLARALLTVSRRRVSTSGSAGTCGTDVGSVDNEEQRCRATNLERTHASRSTRGEIRLLRTREEVANGHEGLGSKATGKESRVRGERTQRPEMEARETEWRRAVAPRVR